jgi:cobalt/nickel transport system permease protein
MIPEWMKEVDAGPCPGRSASKGKRNFVGKTLSGIFDFLEETIVSESYARRRGLLQSLDPRVKLISIIALIVAMTMVTDWRLMLFVYALTLVFAYVSGIGLRFFIKRVWLFIPIFTGIIALPMIFNVFFPGDSLVTLMTLGPGARLGPLALPETIAITRQGTIGAIAFTMRVATCVSAAVLLFLTTPRDVLFKSLRSVGVPKVYVLTLDMCYRYIFLLTDLVKAFYTAKKSRSIKSLPLLEEQKWVGGRIGYTLVKSLDMAEKVHGAMVSRGFNGDVKLMEDFAMRPRDYAALLSVVSFSLLLILYSHQIIRI